MRAYWVSLADLPPGGVDFVVDDAAMWEELVEEFHLDCRLTQTPQAKLHVLPVEEGVLVRGRIAAGLILPCSRCAEDAAVSLEEHFEHFVALSSGEAGETEDPEYGAEAHVRILPGGMPELDIAALCGEEFVLALPVKILCAPECMGLCPACGINRNESACDCSAAADSRLAALRGLKIQP